LILSRLVLRIQQNLSIFSLFFFSILTNWSTTSRKYCSNIFIYSLHISL
jgi:hypothetical protein